jgi:hypothetical protein
MDCIQMGLVKLPDMRRNIILNVKINSDETSMIATS